MPVGFELFTSDYHPNWARVMTGKHMLTSFQQATLSLELTLARKLFSPCANHGLYFNFTTLTSLYIPLYRLNLEQIFSSLELSLHISPPLAPGPASTFSTLSIHDAHWFNQFVGLPPASFLFPHLGPFISWTCMQLTFFLQRVWYSIIHEPVCIHRCLEIHVLYVQTTSWLRIFQPLRSISAWRKTKPLARLLWLHLNAKNILMVTRSMIRDDHKLDSLKQSIRVGNDLLQDTTCDHDYPTADIYR